MVLFTHWNVFFYVLQMSLSCSDSFLVSLWQLPLTSEMKPLEAKKLLHAEQLDQMEKLVFTWRH